jgi:hypothetical protein
MGRQLKTGHVVIIVAAICTMILVSPMIATLLTRFSMPAHVVETFETYTDGQAIQGYRWASTSISGTTTSFTAKQAGTNMVGRFIDASTTEWPSARYTVNPSPKQIDVSCGMTVVINDIPAEAIYIWFGYQTSPVWHDIAAFGFVAFGTNSPGHNFINVNDKFCAGINWAMGDTFDIKFSFVNATGIRVQLRQNGADLAPILRTTRADSASHPLSILTLPVTTMSLYNAMYGAGGMFDVYIDNLCTSW